MRPQNHCAGARVGRRNAMARAAWALRGGPPPAAHHRYTERNIISAIAASGAPSFRRKSGHTLAATRPISSPEMMARSEIGNFDQALGVGSFVVMVTTIASWSANRSRIIAWISPSSMKDSACEIDRKFRRGIARSARAEAGEQAADELHRGLTEEKARERSARGQRQR